MLFTIRQLFITLIIVITLITHPVASAVSQPPIDETIHYTVKKGDTLWGIANQLLGKAWVWRAIWQQNPSIDQPNLIFPGDVLVVDPNALRLLRSSRPGVEKLSPRIRIRPIEEAITTIDPTAIRPFLTQSIIVDDDSLTNAGYVLQGTDGKIVLGRFSQFYARGLKGTAGKKYNIFRMGRKIIDPISGYEFGFQGVHLGAAKLIESADVSTLEVVSANQEIRPGDRLTLQQKPEPVPHYFPHAPSFNIETRIIMIPRGVDEAGRRDIIMIGAGKQDGLELGHVLLIGSDNGEIQDPVTDEMVALPHRRIGTAMVFKLYSKMAYAILMETNGAIKVGDVASTPN